VKRCLVPAAILAVVAGCSAPNATVSGDVSYDGKPVKNGYVTFMPSNGQGAVAGGPISDGKYTVKNVPPGPKIVKVEAADKAGPSIQTTEELEKFSRENKGKVGPDGIISTESVPQDAVGNNQTMDVMAGPQTIDLHLKKPGGKK
jgi:hypothetical protein